MKILVTGARGFIGQPLCARLRQDGHDVLGAVRSDLPEVASAIKWAKKELTAHADWTDLLRDSEVVIHLAAQVPGTSDRGSNDEAMCREVNTLATLNLARQAAACGVGRFIFLSSIKVNGEASAPEFPFGPDDAPAPEDPYGLSKKEAEEGLLDIAAMTGMEVVIIRPPLVYGPGVKGNFAAMVRWLKAGIPLPLGAIKGNVRSLIAMDNLIDFIALCANRTRSPNAANQCFLVSDGEDVSTTALLERVGKAYGIRTRLLPVPASWLKWGAHLFGKNEAAGRLLNSLAIDNRKAFDLLGWRPIVSMDEQLKKMAQHDSLA